MDILFDIVNLIVAVAAAGAILFGIYRGLRWRFPRLSAFRARLIVGLGAVVLLALATNRHTTSDAQCLAHENTVLLRGERVINFRQSEVARPARAADTPQYSSVLKSCTFLLRYCPLDGFDKAGVTTRKICGQAAAGAPLN